MMRVSTIPDWPRPARKPPVSSSWEELQTAAILVKRHGDAFVPFFEILEAEEANRQRRVDARRRAFKLVVDNSAIDAYQDEMPASPGVAA